MLKRKVDTKFFDVWSSDMAYILGYIFADGCLVEHKNGYHELDITSKDLWHLRTIRKHLKSEHKIGKKERGYRIQIRNRNIYDDLLRLGLTPRKSRIVQFPRLPRRYSSDFVRGLFDGDGSVMVWRESRWRHTYQIRTSFTSGSKIFLEDLKKYLYSAVGLSYGKIAPVKGAYHLRYLSMPECLTLYRFMYRRNARLYLRRKKVKFELFASLKNKEHNN